MSCGTSPSQVVSIQDRAVLKYLLIEDCASILIRCDKKEVIANVLMGVVISLHTVRVVVLLSLADSLRDSKLHKQNLPPVMSSS